MKKGRGRNTKEVPRMEKQSFWKIAILFSNCKVSGQKLLWTIPFKLFKNYHGKVPSIAVTHSIINILKWVKQDVDAHYLSSYLYHKILLLKPNLVCNSLKNFPKVIPYNCSCPAAQDVINRQLCSVCGLYLAFIKKM